MDISKLTQSEWKEHWTQAKKILSESIAPNQIQTWIQPLQFIQVHIKSDPKTFVLSAPNEFVQKWVLDRFSMNLENAIAEVTGFRFQVDILPSPPQEETVFMSQEKEDITSTPEEELKNTIPTITSSAAFEEISGSNSKKTIFHQLDTRYTFDNFVVGTSNQFAHASAFAVADRPAREYNPLFIYSNPGLGKTHLLHAIGNHLKVHHPELRVAYLSADSFVNDFIESIKSNTGKNFREKYRESYDVILFDDIQFLAGKARSEEEFFHTFNSLHSSKRQIVVTSDRPPKEIIGLNDRIRSRFEWGLTVDINQPDIETRIAILKHKAEEDDLYLPDDVATFLATQVKSNVRELEGILTSLKAHSSLSGSEITLEMAKKISGHLAPQSPDIDYTVELIQNTIVKHFQIKAADLKSSSKKASVALPRQIAMFLIRKYTPLAFKEIGEFFGGKDHTTVLHACKKIEDSMDHNPSVRQAVEMIQSKL